MSNDALTGQSAAFKPLWKRSLLWLLVLGPFFFLSYGYSNQLAARQGVAREIVYGWEAFVPFVPWTIIPYWSIDLFYGLSLLLCTTRQRLNRHALRLLSAQIIAVSCFLLYPLKISAPRTQAEEGLFGNLFTYLYSFDQPYNQMPSLHIALLLIIWERFHEAAPRHWRWLVNGWAVLIGISVLTTGQHHFIDIPTGLLTGAIVMWLWPLDHSPPLTLPILYKGAQRLRLTTLYLLGSCLVFGVAFWHGGSALWLGWLSVALAMVAVIYAMGNPAAFQKGQGRHSLPLRLMLLPVTFGAWLNSRWWTRHAPQPVCVSPNVWLGRLPRGTEMRDANFSALCDLTAELPAPQGDWRYHNLPWLDLLPPSAAQLREAAAAIEDLSTHGKTLVCCALGFSRSVCAVVAWLVLTGRSPGVQEAVALVRQLRPALVLRPAHLAALEQLERP